MAREDDYGQVYPEYYESAISYINGRDNYFCNMFIMKKELFFEYCNYIFPILKK